MSQGNLERVKASYEALKRKDFDGAVEIAHPEIEFVPPGGQFPRRGVEAVRAWMEPDAFETQSFEPLDFRVNGNRILVHQHVSARGAGSGIELELDSWAVWTFDDEGRATRIEGYLPQEEAQALEAAGLEE